MSQKFFKVLVTHPEVPKIAIDKLKLTCDVKVLENSPVIRSDVLKNCKNVDALFWAEHTKLNGEVLDTVGKNLKAVSTMSAGLDYVDVEEFKKRQIPLGHTPKVLSESVAELAIGLMLAACRRFHEGRQQIELSSWGSWRPQWMLGQPIRDSTIGFVGFGGIGQEIARRLTGFKVEKMIYYSRNPNPNAIEFNAIHSSFDEVLKESDFIFVACPLTPETKNMFDEGAFNKMKSNSVLVNIARGQIIDQKALQKALSSGQIFAAGLDVCTPEPLPPDDPLMKLPNCVIIPHLGSATLRTREEMALLAANNILAALNGKRMISPAY